MPDEGAMHMARCENTKSGQLLLRLARAEMMKEEYEGLLIT